MLVLAPLIDGDVELLHRRARRTAIRFCGGKARTLYAGVGTSETTIAVGVERWDASQGRPRERNTTLLDGAGRMSRRLFAVPRAWDCAAARRTFVARCSRWPSDHPTHRRVSCEIADEHLLLIKSQLGDIRIFDTHDHLTQAHCIVARIPPSMFLVVDGSANVCGRQY